MYTIHTIAARNLSLDVVGGSMDSTPPHRGQEMKNSCNKRLATHMARWNSLYHDRFINLLRVRSLLVEDCDWRAYLVFPLNKPQMTPKTTNATNARGVAKNMIYEGRFSLLLEDRVA